MLRLLALRPVAAGLLVAIASLGFAPVAQATQSNQDTPLASRVVSGSDVIEAQEFLISDSRVSSLRQTITAWRVSTGTWNGVSLEGLSLVMVKTSSIDNQVPASTNCYISYPATAAQRNALLSAYVTSKSLPTAESSTWRIEPAVIRFEFGGQTVIIHIGMIV